jgi:hypothetical protein
MGLTVRDWRYVVRIANIDRSLLSADYATGPKLPDLMYQAMEIVPNLSGARFAFYMDRTIRTKVRQQLSSARVASTLSVNEVGGRMVQMFQEIPMRRVDALRADEARVV